MLAVISDVHANVHALDAVLDNLPEQVDQVVCLGDTVGYGPHPREAVERVREVATVTVQGNHDRHITDPTTYSNPMAVEGLRHAQRELHAEHFEWLRTLPMVVDHQGVGACHAHPKDITHRVGPEDVGDAYGKWTPHLDVLFVGHTHTQYERRVDGCVVVNPGSVGQPRDGDRRAAYALYDAERGVELRRVEYDVAAAQAAVRDAGLPEATAERLAAAN